MSSYPRPKTSNVLPVTLLFLGMALGVFSTINLSGHAQPMLALNDKIIAGLATAATLPPEAQMQSLISLREDQEKALIGMPAEPFAWARYSYLRLATQGDKHAALAALALSDLVSPDEPRQLPERALMWQQLTSVENADQQAYQTTLWQKAFLTQPDQTWDIAKHSGLIDQIGVAIKQGDPEEYEVWKSRVNN